MGDEIARLCAEVEKLTFCRDELIEDCNHHVESEFPSAAASKEAWLAELSRRWQAAQAGEVK